MRDLSHLTSFSNSCIPYACHTIEESTQKRGTQSFKSSNISIQHLCLNYGIPPLCSLSHSLPTLPSPHPPLFILLFLSPYLLSYRYTIQEAKKQVKGGSTSPTQWYCRCGWKKDISTPQQTGEDKVFISAKKEELVSILGPQYYTFGSVHRETGASFKQIVTGFEDIY